MNVILKIVFLFLSGVGLAAHPVHVSVINMEIRKDKMCIDYSVRLFEDDYTYLVTGIYHDELAEAKRDSTIDAYKTIVTNYLQESFDMTIDGNKTNPEFSGLKYDDTDLWLHYRIELDQLPDSILIKNKIFVELFSDQINLLILTYDSIEKGYTFDRQTTEQLISLKNIYK